MILLPIHVYRAWRSRQARAGLGEPAGGAGAGRPVGGGGAGQPVGGGGAGRPRPSAASRGLVTLLGHQVRYDLLASLRNPRARFFTFFFPVLLLVIFTGVFGHGTTTVDGVTVSLDRFYVPGILALAIIVASYSNLVVSVASSRETGVLKRRRATPVPPAVLIAGQALSTVLVAVGMGALLLLLARVGFHVGLAPGAIAAVALTTVIGTLAFACVGYAVSGLIGSVDAAQPIVQATTMPLFFISGVWVPTQHLSPALHTLASVFPVEHLAAALHLASVRGSFAAALSPADLLVLGLWAVLAIVLAAVRFSWLPSVATA